MFLQEIVFFYNDIFSLHKKNKKFDQLKTEFGLDQLIIDWTYATSSSNYRHATDNIQWSLCTQPLFIDTNFYDLEPTRLNG